jgi:hypothetical protein
MRGNGWGWVLASVVGMTGCGGEETLSEESHLGQRTASLGVGNGVSLNGSSLNGRNLNGRNLNGRNLNGEALNRALVSVDHAGVRVERWGRWSGEGGWQGWGSGSGGWMVRWEEPLDDAVWLEGTVLHGRLRGQPISGMDFARTRFVGNRGDGSRVELRVDAVTPGGDGEVWTYRVSYREPTNGRWYPICQDARGRPVDAIAVAGRWDYREGVPGVGGAKYDDPSAFTFACEGAAIAKCIRFGYRPWASRGGVSLAAHHQACTRLLRADYCGDGTSHTVDGQWVNLYDALEVQRDTEAWALEAEWDTEGARCLTSAHRAREPVSCGGAPLARCGRGEDFSPGVLLRSETP